MIAAARFRLQLLRALSFAIVAVLACSATLSAQTLMWNANTETNLAGYIVQYGTQSGSPSTSIDVGNVTSRTITGLTAGTTYYFRVVAYNTSGLQSTPSTQISYTVPGGSTAPTITSVSPTSGPATGGTLITITGTSFATGATVRVGGTLATGITLVSSTQLRATTPAGSAGARDVQVTNSSGSSATRVGAFTYTATSTTPTLTSVSPTSGPTTGGTTITLTGTNFVSGATVRVAALGFIADLGPLQEWGIEVQKRHVVVGPSMQTSLERVFAAGDITEYPGKVRLIAVGFGEAATAVNNAAVAIDPSAHVFPGHSSEGS